MILLASDGWGSPAGRRIHIYIILANSFGDYIAASAPPL
jgi:hypothetical protein